MHISLQFITFFLAQRFKGNQIQKQIREEMDVLADHVTSLNTHREAQTQLVKKLEEREKALQNAVVRDGFLSFRARFFSVHDANCTLW